MKDVVAEWFVTGLGMAVWGLPFLGFLFWWWKNFFSSYASKKGENLATREDIGKITVEVEKVRMDFNSKLEELKAHHQLRVMAAERRIEVHQQAFNKWRQLYVSVNGGMVNDMMAQSADCMQWVFDNYVYLEEKAREDFSNAIKHVFFLVGNAEMFLAPGQISVSLKILEEAQKSILAAVTLPALNKGSLRILVEGVEDHPPGQGST